MNKKLFSKTLAVVLAGVVVASSVPVVNAQAAAAKTMTVSKKKTALNVGVTKAIKTTGNPRVKVVFNKKASNKNFKVTSSNAEVVSVTKVSAKKYQFTGVAAGTATLTITSNANKELVRTVDVTVKEDAAIQPVASQTGVKQITVTGNKFEGKTAADFVVKKGATSVNVSACEVSVDGKTAVLTTTATLTGDYSVTVNELTANFTAEAGKIAAIEVESDVAIATVNLPTADASGTATAGYVVKNQFGEDITKTTAVQCYSPGATVDGRGTITFALAQGAKADDPLTVFLMNGTVTVQKTLKLSNRAYIASMAIKGAYNADNKTLTEGTIADNEFFLLIDAKDQYGKQVTSANLAHFTTSITGIQGLNLVTTGTVKSKTVDGVEYLAIPFAAGTFGAGTASLNILSTDGAYVMTAGTVTVADKIKVDTFTVAAQGPVYYGEDAYFDVTAVDTYGNEITTLDGFNTMTSVPAGFSFVKKDDKIVGKMDAASVPQTFFYGTFVTATSKYVPLQISVLPAAEAVSILNLKDATLGCIAKAGKSVKISMGNLEVQDNYGRIMSLDTLAAKGYQVKATLVNDGDAIFTTTGASVAITKNAGDTAATFDFVKAGTQTAMLTLYKADNTEVANSAIAFNITASAVSAITSYKVEEVPMMLDTLTTTVSNAADYAQELKVIGVLADGTELLLDNAAEFFVSCSNLTVGADGKLTVTKAPTYEDKATEAETTLVVTINATGQTFSQKIKISKAAPVASSASYKDGESATIAVDAALTTVVDKLALKDQYGVAATDVVTSIVIVPTSTKGTIAGNGTPNAAITGTVAGDTFKVTFNYADGLAYTTDLVVE